MAAPPPPLAHTDPLGTALVERSAPKLQSVLALDVGRRRVGLAGCDRLGITVTPLPPLARRRFALDQAHLGELVRQRQVTALVVGLPLDSKGQITVQASHCLRYGQRLARQLGLPLAWVNEHSSSWAAAELNGLQGDRSGALDSAAAALLLKQWLLEGPEPVLPATIPDSASAAFAPSWGDQFSEDDDRTPHRRDR